MIHLYSNRLTCFGINNEGQLVLDYYHEDTDFLEGANVYNGQNSTLWCNFREAFPDKIKETYQDLRSNSILNYDELIEQFITNGSDKWSESIYNEDADFKYISMLQSDNDASNLGQVRGTGEEHLRYYFENRLNYCDGKWYAADYADDYVALRIYTPNEWTGVEPNASITVTPYSHMYAGVRYKANGTLYQERTAANEPVTFAAPNETFNDTETAIYGASQLSSLGDLSPLYCGSINVSKATKLTELIIGSNVEGYSNPNLNDLSVGTNNLLKTINVRNCPKLTDPLVLTGCPNIEYIYAKGSGITGIELAPSGYVKILELPSTISNLTLTNQPYIESLTLENYNSIKTIWLENCPTVNSLNILRKSPNVERARLTNVNWSYPDTSALYELIDRNIAGIDENGTNTEHMWIDGKCHIEALTGAEFNEIRELYPYLEITYTTLTSQLVYMSEDGTAEIHRETIVNIGNGSAEFDMDATYGTLEYGKIDYQTGKIDNGDKTRAYTDYLPVESKSSVRLHFANMSNFKFVIRLYDSNHNFMSSGASVPDAWSGSNDGSWYYVGTDDGVLNIESLCTNNNLSYENVKYIRFLFTIDTVTEINKVRGSVSIDDTLYDLTSQTPLFTKESTAQYHFTYGGWSLTPGGDPVADILVNIEGDRIVYVAYHKELRSYTVNFYNGEKLEHSEIVNYGFDAKYSISPTPEFDYLEFIGWKPEPVNISGDLDCYAQFYDTREIADDWVTIAENCANGSYVEKYPIGAYKPVEINYEDGTSETIDFEVIAHDHDELTDDATRWIPTDINHGIPVRNVCLCGTKLYLSYSGGLEYWEGTTKTIIGKPDNYSLYHCLLNVNDELHVISSSGVAEHPYHYKYNIANNEWVEVSIMPTSKSPNYANAVVYNNSIYYICDNKKCYVYDGTSWGDEQTLPVGAGPRTPVVVYNNEIHIVTGSKNTNITQHYKFDGESWTLVCETPYNMHSTKLVIHNNAIYAFGGNGNPKACYKFNGTKWVDTGITSYPWTSFDRMMVEWNGKIHWVGAANKVGIANYRTYCLEERGWVKCYDHTGTICDSVMVFNDEIWGMRSGMLTNYGDGTSRKQGYGYTSTINKYSCRSLVFRNEIHMFASKDSAAVPNHYKYDFTNNDWVEIPGLSEHTTYGPYYSSSVVFNDLLYYFDGGGRSGYYVYDGESWTDYKLPEKSYTGFSLCVHDNKLHAFLGSNYDKHYVFDGEEWKFICTSPKSMKWASIISYKNELHSLGGTFDYTSWYTFDGKNWSDSGIKTLTDNYSLYKYVIIYRNRLYMFNTSYINNSGTMSLPICRLENPKAPLTFLAKNVSKYERVFNSIAATSVKWSNSELREFCSNELFNSLPEELQGAIQPVIKISDTGIETLSLEDVIDTCWIPSVEELGSEPTIIVPGQGSAYSVFTDDRSRIRGDGGAYWTRSMNTNAGWRVLAVYASSGAIAGGGVSFNGHRAFLPGFCIGAKGVTDDV